MFRCLLLIGVFAVSGCDAPPHELAKCHGPLEVMNTDKWRPSAMEIAALDQVCPEDK